MQYLLQNHDKYTYIPCTFYADNDFNAFAWTQLTNITTRANNLAYITYYPDDYTSYDVRYYVRIRRGYNEVQSGTYFELYERTFDDSIIASIAYVSIRPTFSCSNFIDITSDDSVTIRLDLINSDEVVFTKEYTYLLKKQPINTVNCIDVINHINKEITTVKITATSTLPLSLYNISPIIKEGITYKLIGEVDIL